MALFSFRKSGSQDANKSGLPAGGNGGGSSSSAGSSDAFEPQPEKARKWFDFAQTAAASQNYDYALHCYASGIRLDPAAMSAHEAMFEAALQYANREGKPASGREIKQIDGPHPVHKFAAAEYVWLKDFYNVTAALRFLEAAAKSGQLEVGHWAASRAFHVLGKHKKVSKSLLLQAKEAFAKVQAWDQAITAAEAAARLDPTDSKLAAEVKDFIAQRAMDQGRYSEAAGREGGYREMIKDSQKQRELSEQESISGSSSVEERNFERALAEYERNPKSPDAISRYAQLLRKRGTLEDEQKSRSIYLKGHEDTGEYRFRMLAGDIDLDQSRRRVAALKEAIAKPGHDSNLEAEYAQALKQYQDLQISEFSERVAKYPTDRRMKMALGEVYFEQGRYDGAMAQFQASKEEPRLRLRAGYLLGRCFAAEGWFLEAESEFKEALAKMDATERDLENDIRYDLMETLMARAREERSEAFAREALAICSDIARKDISFRDILNRRREVNQLVKELGGGAGPGGAMLGGPGSSS